MQLEMQEYFAELSQAEQRQVLEMAKTLLANHSENDSRISIDQYNREIDETLEDVAHGNYITQDDIERQSAQWHRK